MIANALLTNQAVVKIVRGGGVTASGRLGGQLSYITRKAPSKWNEAIPAS